MVPKSTTSGSSTGKGGGALPNASAGLRELLSSAAQHWLELHLGSPPLPGQRHGRRPSSRIRSWVRDGNSDDGGDNSLHFADASDDDEFAGSGPGAIASTSHNNNNPKVSTTNPHIHTSIQAHGPVVKMHTLSPDELREEEMLDMLISMMGDGFDREVARRILRKYDGNMEKAALALLEGERGEEMLIGPAGAPGQTQSQGWPAVGGGAGSSSGGGGGGASAGWPGSAASSQAPQTRLDSTLALSGRPNTPVIDLTLDDDQDLQRAMQESMNTQYAGQSSSSAQRQVYAPSYAQTQSTAHMYAAPSQPPSQTQAHVQSEGPVFGPSERPADPSWAMVPSHVAQNESNDANYLQNLDQAIKASLETMGDSDAFESFPVEQQLRRDGCPVVLRPSMHTMVYAASILQGLFYVPQVRERMARWRPPVMTDGDDAGLSVNDPDYTLWCLSDIFTHMDLARLCDLNVDKRLPAFEIEPWERPAQSPGELSRKFFARLSITLEKAFIDQFARTGQPLPKPRLLHFQYGSGISEPGEVLQETSIVPIDVNGGESNDLIGRLSAQLSKPQSEPGKQSVIFEPSEMVAFELVRSSSAGATGGTERKLFTYPKSIYLDQFLKENVAVAQAKRAQRQEMFDEVQRLVLHKKALTHFDGKDTLKDLRSSIFYFENVAHAGGDLERNASIQATTRKLKAILATIEEEITVTDENINALRVRADTLLDCDELQQFKYDLRVVFVHDGLYGRKHLYSYVQDRSCWWRIADSLIEKVTEEVALHDQAGLHLGAGPYLLLYSRAIPEDEGYTTPLPWMDDLKDDVKAANREFLSQLPPELVRDIAIDDEDMSLPSVVMLKGGSVGDGMDIS